jgi:transcriptional regulator with XRE-family HTH domain
MARRQIPAAELARKLAVNETWVGRRMRGKSAITMSDLELIATALEVPLSYFMPAPERVA